MGSFGRVSAGSVANNQ